MSKHNANQTNFPDNLQLLCTYYKSISEVCRKLSINRSQFNRYLNGSSTPSNFITRKLCDFFGVELHEMYLPSIEFEQLISDKPNFLRNLERKESSIAQHIETLQGATSEEVNRYLGYYYEYYYSMTFPDKVLKSLVHISRDANQIVFQRHEFLGEPGSQRTSVKCRYEGVLYFLQDRIFLVDYETLTLNEMTQTVLYPSFYSKVDFLIGLKLGVSAVRDRKPLVRNVVFESLGKSINLLTCIKATGLYSANAESIPPFILSNLDKKIVAQ